MKKTTAAEEERIREEVKEILFRFWKGTKIHEKSASLRDEIIEVSADDMCSLIDERTEALRSESVRRIMSLIPPHQLQVWGTEPEFTEGRNSYRKDVMKVLVIEEKGLSEVCRGEGN